MPAQIIYENKADAATVTASSWIASAPSTQLQNIHVSRRWKGASGATEYILTSSIASFNAVGLFGIQGIDGSDNQANLSSAAITRLRVSSADPTGVAGDVYDSGSVAGRISASYGQLVFLLTSVVSGYIRIDLTEAGMVALLAGRLVVGLRNEFTYNFSYGWSYGYTDLSRKRESAGGQIFIERDDRYRVLNLSFDTLASADRLGFVDEIDRLNGISQDVLFVINPNTSNLGRDVLWGLIQDMNPPSQPNLAAFSKSYSIKERR